jgi:uncharacterized membrane protein YraQ (UPF0718 family)
MKITAKERNALVTSIGFLIFVGISALTGFTPGLKSGLSLITFLKGMAGVLPPAFILIGLFEVWVKREVIEKHMGEESGLKGYIWAYLLAGTMVGGLYVTLPLCYVLQKKGASLGVLFTFINCSAICRIPMTLFEISFLGVPFTVIRYLVSIPLLTLVAIMMDRYLKPFNYQFQEGER